MIVFMNIINSNHSKYQLHFCGIPVQEVPKGTSMLSCTATASRGVEECTAQESRKDISRFVHLYYTISVLAYEECTYNGVLAYESEWT